MLDRLQELGGRMQEQGVERLRTGQWLCVRVAAEEAPLAKPKRRREKCTNGKKFT